MNYPTYLPTKSLGNKKLVYYLPFRPFTIPMHADDSYLSFFAQKQELMFSCFCILKVWDLELGAAGGIATLGISG